MSIDDVVAALDAIDTADCEGAHGEADMLLQGFVPEEVRQAYLRVVRRCSWWACA